MQTEKVLEFNAVKRGGRRTVVLTKDGRVCTVCQKAKSWDEFSKDAHGYNKKGSYCTECKNEKNRIAYKKNPRSGIKNRPDKLKRLYGITYTDAVRALDAQYGRCANRACGKEISLEVKFNTPNRAVIDHNHKTGKFRAMLCSPCNFLLGTLETKENLILGLTEYLSKYK